MRGLEQIKSINETPHELHDDSNEHEQFRPSQSHAELHGRPSADDIKKILEEITGGQMTKAKLSLGHERTLDLLTTIDTALGNNTSPEKLTEMAAVARVFGLLGLRAPDDYDDAKALAIMLAAKAITTLDGIIGDKPTSFPSTHDIQKAHGQHRHLGMDGIHSAIDAKPDFLKFWQKLNDDRAADGEDEASYGEAKTVFSGGPTPSGALTFIGKEWEGLRAVPAKTHEGRKTYHGEFRSIAAEGNSIWNVVSNTATLPIAYANAEAALSGARHARIHSEARKS